jgi:site-specific DNA-cytosine methylase
MQNKHSENPEPGNRANVVLNAVLSFFDGMSCGQIALNKAGIQYENYYACEIDESAIKVTQKNFPGTKQLGDVSRVYAKDLPKIDLFIGGSPCQSFSSFGNGSGFDGKSGLFWEYVRVLKEIRQTNPKVLFMLENVNMKKEWRDIISKELGVEPIAFNSNLVSAQNRDRLYWTNIKFDLPKDKNILFSNILENLPFREIPKCFYKNWGDKMRIDKGLNWVKNDKANCLTTKNCHTNQYLLNEDKTLCRLLTAKEFEKLQTVPENYTDCVSNTERFKMLGNGWTVDVIAHIFNGIT